MGISPLRRLGLITIALAGAASLHARDPWFPDGPLQPQIPHGVLLPQIRRTPQFPLKTARTLYSDAEIARARANITAFPAAKAIADKIVAEADYWAAWSDQALHDLITTAEVPRAVELCNAGCPIHGRKIFEVGHGSSYPWIFDPKQPFKVKCPVGGETYPDNDYGAYYRSGFKDKASLTGKIVDDGWGWVGPDGQRYWFVAHANHLMWQQLNPDSHAVIPAIQFLGRAYVLTGNPLYAHKAAILLHRVAEVYPTMNYEQQSRFGQLMAEQGTRYTGKVVNLIWESYLVAPALSEAYDDVWETLDRDAVLQAFYHETGEQIRACIEANYLEDAIDGYFDNKLRGNYGTHQRALLQLAVVRQHGDNRRYVDEVLHRPEGHLLRIGFDYAFYDSVYRDGAPHESPDYNFIWPRLAAASAELLKKLGTDVTALPRVRRLFDAPLDFITTGRHSPALGDSKTLYAPVIGDEPLVYQRAYRLYGDPRYAAFVAGIGAVGEKSFGSYEALFSPALPAPAAGAAGDGRVVPPQPSRVLSGYGYFLLNNPADTRSVGLFYGLHVAHYHHDRLHFDLFARGQALTPDLGYPDGANEFNSSIYTWSKTSISHNTVTVDAHRQPANPAGKLRLFADGPFARAATASADDTYPQTKLYERTLVMVDVPGVSKDDDRGYVVDFFDVVGGHQHDYSLHGPLGPFTSEGGVLSAPEPGTLAGRDVAVGALYDDPVRGAKDFKGSYLNYEGSGFQHLVDVRRLESGDDTFVADYTHDLDPAARLRIRILPQAGQELIVAHARVSPIKFPEILTYLIARRIAPASAPELSSRFAAVLEPYASEPFIASVQRRDLVNGAVVTVTRRDGTRDVIFHHRGDDTAVFARDDAVPLATDAEVAVVTLDPRGQPVRAFFAGGSFLEMGPTRLVAHAIEGKITGVDARRGQLRVRLSPGSAVGDLSALRGRVVHLVNPLRDTVQTITAAERSGDELVLTLKDDLRVGLVHVDRAEGRTVETKTWLHLAPMYRGVTLCARDDTPLATVSQVVPGTLTLTDDLAAPVAAGADLWLIDAAVGETVRLSAIRSWQAAR